MNRKKILAVAAVLFAMYAIFAQTADEAYALFKTGNDYFNAKDYDTAITYYARAVPLYEKVYGTKHLYTADIYFFLGTSYSRTGNYQTSLPWLEKALAIYDSPQGDKSSAANALFEIGQAYSNLSDYETALDYYQKSLAVRKKVSGENNEKTALCYVSIGFVYEVKGDYKNSSHYYQKALMIRQKVFGENHLTTADSYHDIGVTNHLLGNYKEALDCFFTALDIRENIAGAVSYEVAHTMCAIAEVYIDTELYEDALMANYTAEQIYTELVKPASYEFCVLFNDKGRIYWKLGNYDKSLQYHEKSLEIVQKLFGEKHVNTAREYLNIGELYQTMGDYSRALANLERSLEITKVIFGDTHLDVALCFLNIGAVYRSKGDFDTALSYFNQALDMYIKLLGEKRIEIAQCYLEIGNIYQNKADYQKAIDCFRKASKMSYEIFGYETTLTAQSYNRIADIYDIWGYPEDAEDLYKAAIRIYSDICGENSIQTALGYISLGWQYAGQEDAKQTVESFKKAYAGFKNATNYKQTILSLSLILKDSKLYHYDTDIPFIRDTIALACDTVERARLDMSSIKSDILQKSLPVYYYGVDFEARNGNPAKAFEYAEMLRSRGFLDEIGLDRALSLDGVMDGERKQVKELTSQIVFARKEIENQNNLELKDRDAKRLTQAEKDLAAAEKSLAKLDGAIGKRLPAYAQLRNPQTVRIKDAQKWCGNDKAILEYVLWNPALLESTDLQGEPIALDSYCLVITNKSVTAIPLDGEYDFDAAITKLRDSVIPRSALAKPTTEVVFEGIRNELYEKLIEPAMPYLKGKKNLVIVPDGSLAFLPFDILRKDEDAKMLCQQFALALSPSVSVSMIADSTRNKGLEMLAFGAAWYDESMSAAEHRRTFESQDMTRGRMRGFVNPAELVSAVDVARYSDSPTGYFGQKNLRWKDLPGTLAELAVLKEKAVGKKRYDEYVQENASESNVKQLSHDGTLAQYPILHFACHGYFDKDFFDMSSILFSEVSGRFSDTSSEDGYLTIPEVATLNLDADMVCLSACETGLGKIKSGDGMTGLTRAFMVAGSRHVGATLWSVDDAATAEFMASMYKKIEKKGMTYEQAYRQTKAEFINSDDYAHPYYWAAFVLYE